MLVGYKFGQYYSSVGAGSRHKTSWLPPATSNWISVTTSGCGPAAEELHLHLRKCGAKVGDAVSEA